jgi:threonine dehydratase
MGLPHTDISFAEIESAVDRIDAAFRSTPQSLSDALSERFGREVVVKNETGTPIGSFKGRGTCLLADELDPDRTWVCSTAGNFGQGLAYAARARGAAVHAFVSPDVPAGKQAGMRALGATVEVDAQPGASARAFVAAGGDRMLVLDGEGPTMAVGAGTMGAELNDAGPFELAVVQVGDGALISGVAAALRAANPGIRIVGVCASGAPAMARSFAEQRVVTTSGANTIATAIAIMDPLPTSLARVRALVDEIVLVDDDDLRDAQRLISEELRVDVEPAGAAGVAALERYGRTWSPVRTAVILTGAAQL